MQQFLSRLGRWFDPQALKRAYMLTFRTPLAAELILPDLAEFCYANEAVPVQGDLFKLGRFAGRQDVWLHIQEYLNLTDEELFSLRKQASVEIYRPKEVTNGMVR